MTTARPSGITLLMLAAPVLAAAGAVLGGSGVVLLALACALLLALGARLTIAGLMAAVLLAEPLAEALKRAVFLLGEDSAAAYYGVQLLPAALLAVALAAALPRLLGARLPTSGIWLAALVAWIGAAAVASSYGTPWFQRLGALHQEILPALIFLPALLIGADPAARATLARAAALVCIVSAAYGMWQFLAGYTGLDLAWAIGAAERSIQAGKVHAWMIGDSWERRIFSLFPDPFTWGQALTGALVIVLLARLGPGWTLATWAAVLIGLTLTQSRTPWLTLAVTGAAWLALGWRPLRRPAVIVGAALAGFPLTLWLGGWAYDTLFTGLPATDDPFLRRYLTVGTIEARLDAWANLRDVLTAHPLTGLGAGTDPRYGAALPLPPALLAAHDSHNVLVKLAILGGLPAVVLFLGFLWRWTREAFPAGSIVCADARLAAAFLLGSQAAGYMNAGIFLTWQYFLVLGLVAGAAAVAKAPPQVVASRLDQSPASRRIVA
ncbi:O-antigen ligase family protein [Caenispirillum salinarum]|uniref:O-antigen ligase family protein n=1 Tax=Caenispirillum salinarum TaxID=859058 RepID=UPI00384D6E0B